MAFIEDKKLLFIHIPKNAGKSIEVGLKLCSASQLSRLGRRSLCNRLATFFLRETSNKDARSKLYGTLDVTLCAQHLTLQEIQLLKLIPRDFLDEARKFAVCRNPWSRAVSTFHHFTSSADRTKENFQSFCESWYDSPASCHNIVAHRRKQIDFIRDCRGKVGVDKILRFENLHEEFTELCKLWELNCLTLPHIGKGKFGYKSYHEVYTDNSRKKIKELFAEDIEFFNYEF